ncbi:MAG: hypothetical protein ISN29_05095 [Gammaproteobacteria bacterium AqS3]|nr:hypothetical protein [Gammaproteobacteria bacterium AqS3]
MSSLDSQAEAKFFSVYDAMIGAGASVGDATNGALIEARRISPTWDWW